MASDSLPVTFVPAPSRWGAEGRCLALAEWWRTVDANATVRVAVDPSRVALLSADTSVEVIAWNAEPAPNGLRIVDREPHEEESWLRQYSGNRGFTLWDRYSAPEWQRTDRSGFRAVYVGDLGWLADPEQRERVRTELHSTVPLSSSARPLPSSVTSKPNEWERQHEATPKRKVLVLAGSQPASEPLLRHANALCDTAGWTLSRWDPESPGAAPLARNLIGVDADAILCHGSLAQTVELASSERVLAHVAGAPLAPTDPLRAFLQRTGIASLTGLEAFDLEQEWAGRKASAAVELGLRATRVPLPSKREQQAEAERLVRALVEAGG